MAHKLSPSKRTERTVFITNRSAHDFSAAKRFGCLEFLSEGMLRKRNVSFMLRKFQAALVDSKPTDYLLPTSLTVMSIIAAVILALKHGRLNLLIFDDGKYKSRTLIFNEEGENNEGNLLETTVEN